MTYQIIFENNPTAEEIAILSRGLSEYATQQRGHKPIEPFAFFIRDENSQIKGGCNGNIGYGWVYIDQLWIDEALRGKDYGTALMRAAEDLAKEKKCLSAVVSTMDWEALDFYKKLGYRVEFERHGVEKSSVCYFLRKDFNSIPRK